MTSRRTRVTIALYVTGIAILIALLGWVWTLPAIGFASAPEPPVATAPASAGAGDGPCDLVVGPAREYCIPGTPEPAASRTAQALHDARQRAHVLVPATIAVAAAVGLIMLAGRRDR